MPETTTTTNTAGTGGSSSSRRSSTNNNNNSSSETTGAAPGGSGWDAVMVHVSGHKIDVILAITRTLTVLCTLSYLLGFPGPSGNRFKQALLMNAATSSLRLHQRMPPPPLNQLSRQYFMDLIAEDSFHYLIFPVMFFTGQPITLALLPCALYALFNLAVFAITILDKLGNQEHLKAEISNFVARYQQSLLYTIALSELVLMFVTVVAVFMRVVNFMSPIFYYRFLMLRYNSSRNHHLKSLIQELKVLASRVMRYNQQ